jgi:hypothetical protein
MLRTSERIDFRRCPQRWWWAWRDGLYESGPPNDKLWFGTGWHLVMAHHYGLKGTKRGKSPLKVWRDWIGEEIPKIRVNLTGNDVYKEEMYIDAASLGEQMIGNYLDTYKGDPSWSMIQVERPFKVVITSPAGERRVIFCGTYDGVYRDESTGYLWLLEHKTAKAISTGHLTMDDQAGGYLMVASRELRNDKLIGPKENVKGIMYNFARKSVKDERPVNKDGLATNKPVKQDYLDQLSEGGFIDLNEKWTLAQLQDEALRLRIGVTGAVSANQPTPLFVRHPVMRTTRERNAQIIRIQAEVEHMQLMREGDLPLYKNPTKDCGWGCKFYQMCVLHESGGPDWEELRDNMFKVRDPYMDHRKSAAGDE